MMTEFTILVEPTTAPRQCRSDTWKPRPCVVKYRKFKDFVRLALLANKITIPDNPWRVDCHFEFAMPTAWSKKKKDDMDGELMQFTPDIDNLSKCWLDTNHKADHMVAMMLIKKTWARENKINVIYYWDT